MTLLYPLDRAGGEERPGIQVAASGARSSGTQFVSFFEPAQIGGLALEAGFAETHVVSADDLTARYFGNRAGDLRPPPRAEEMLAVRT